MRVTIEVSMYPLGGGREGVRRALENLSDGIKQVISQTQPFAIAHPEFTVE